MDSHPSSSHYVSQAMQSSDSHYATHQQHQHAHTPQLWPTASHLLQPGHNSSPFHSPPGSSAGPVSDQQYSGYYHASHNVNDGPLERSSSLSLNLSSLTVASPTNLSPINPSPHPSSSANSNLSPITPLSPTSVNTTPQQHGFSAHHSTSHSTHHHRNVHTFAYAPPESNGIRYDSSGGGGGQYDLGSHRPATSRSSTSSSDKSQSVPRKRSFTGLPTPLAISVEEENIFDETGGISMDLSTPASFDEVDIAYAGLDSHGSPVEGSLSSGEHEDQYKATDLHVSSSTGSVYGMPHGSMNVLGKASGTNNFVTKLYMMINDPKSANFIAWNELGTSFVVSNVGEFSRSILGSHFKHNNFSSFVRQLNMYGFHKINRTPRAQRTSTDAQTWEFSHHKFLRGRPDLLDEIKRKALEPDPSIKQRVELPGEVASQLYHMRESSRKLAKALDAERNKVERLTNVTKMLFDFVSKAYPGSLPLFPSDLLESNDSFPMFVTTPSAGTPYTYGNLSYANSSMHSLSPGSSPTTGEFPSHPHVHALSRTHSLQHLNYTDNYGQTITTRYDSAIPLPPSPVQLDAFDTDHGRKRQRTGPPILNPQNMSNNTTDASGIKRMSRARSDSAPLGYGINQPWGHGTRPRSGTGIGLRGGRRDDVIPSLSAAGPGRSGTGVPPLLSLIPPPNSQKHPHA